MKLFARFRTNRKLQIGAIVALVLLIGMLGFWFVASPAGKQLAEKRDFDITLKAVGKLYDLPDETPVLATVSDKEKLLSQPFFNEAENGDKVLVFNTARKVILYRPSTNKIINVASINVDTPGVQAQLPPQAVTPPATPEQQSESSASAEEVPAVPVTVVILNGTAISGLTQKVQQQLRDSGVDSTVLVRDNAVKRDYESTTIIPLTPAGEAMAPTFEKALSANIGTLPEGERTRTTDILIIAGTDAASF